MNSAAPKINRTRVAHQYAPADEGILAAILELLLDLNRKVDAISNQRATDSPVDSDTAAPVLLRAIADIVGDHGFTAADLLLRVPPPADAPLRRAIVRAVRAESPRRIGKLLKRYEGADVAGLRVVRVGVERDGIVWQVVACLRV